MVIANYSNPTGSAMPDARKRALVKLCREADIALIEDDIYGDLCFSAERPRPVKAFDTSGNVLSCSSYSKTISPALRVGYVAAGKYTGKVKFLKTVSSGATSHRSRFAISLSKKDQT